MLLPNFSSQREKEKYFRSLNDEQKIDALNEMVDISEHIVFLGGAGVSTESGIPDFRSKNGLYHKKDKRFSMYKPEYLLSYDCLNKRPAVFFDYFRKNLDCRSIEPNNAHRKLFQMEQRGKLDGVITQNIDGLHQKAGSKKVCEIHGSALRSYCVSCKTDYGADFIFENTEDVPHCPKCGKVIRPDVTLYGEFLPQRDYEEAVALIRYADLLIIGGTSLEVGSAAQLAHMYHGKFLVIINKGKTKMEGRADLVFHDSIGKIMNQIEI
ncbi:NAD-dependent protein deacylase [Butyrivibrio sp. AE3004]|uniref:NAD-dependent protein deacylase n=1 Tax=Butyrivibrio sp. AE3004 TaxID=1506994 RepID=UPI0009DE64C4|nr:NAD-dependent protein deacylase [Butyrivibrio sp. AE3004]